MARGLFLLLVSSFLTIVLNPEFLTADRVAISKLPQFNAVETVEIIEPEPAHEPIREIAYQRPVAQAATASVYTPPANYIAIAGRTLNVVQVSNTLVDSGNHVNRYGDKFLYGHNTGAVFAVLYNMGVGGTFTVTLGGTTTNYRVTEVIIYEKNVELGTLERGGQGNYMGAVANARNKDTGAIYDLALMTCYGTPYGGGDASHRYVVFANAF